MGLILHTLGREWGQRGDRHDSPQCAGGGMGSFVSRSLVQMQRLQEPGQPPSGRPASWDTSVLRFIYQAAEKGGGGCFVKAKPEILMKDSNCPPP